MQQLRIFIISLALLVLVIPILLVKDNIFLSTTSDYLFLAHRLLGLYAFSFIFLQIIIGSARPLLSKVFPPNKVLSFHMTQGKIAFTLALLHPILIYATYLTEKNLSYVDSFTQGSSAIYFNFGIAAYILLIVSVGAAIFRFKIGPKWIYLHRTNYIIFWLIFFHSSKLGVDTQGDLALWVYRFYGFVVAALTARRILNYFQSKQLATSPTNQ